MIGMVAKSDTIDGDTMVLIDIHIKHQDFPDNAQLTYVFGLHKYGYEYPDLPKPSKDDLDQIATLWK